MGKHAKQMLEANTVEKPLLLSHCTSMLPSKSKSQPYVTRSPSTSMAAWYRRYIRSNDASDVGQGVMLTNTLQCQFECIETHRWLVDDLVQLRRWVFALLQVRA